jgi:hypothetical protein
MESRDPEDITQFGSQHYAEGSGQSDAPIALEPMEEQPALLNLKVIGKS